MPLKATTYYILETLSFCTQMQQPSEETLPRELGYIRVLYSYRSQQKTDIIENFGEMREEIKKMMEETSLSEQEHAKTSNQDSFPTSRKKRSDNTKRFSDEQVKSLESMFHKGAKLEPRNKLQLAKDLGLQPRQVSIWFQNKRARWKSKRMEQEYTALKANYDALYQQYESLKKENESLREQLGTLNSMMENPHRKQTSSRDSNENVAAPPSTEQNSEREESHERPTNSNVDTAGINEYCREQEEPESITFSDQEDSWKASRKQWCGFVPGGILDDPSCPPNWWDF